MISINKQTAVKPPQIQAATQRVTHGIAIIDSRVTLMGMEVVFDSAVARAGDTIYVHSNVVNSHKWTKEIYDVDGQQFVLVPDDMIVLVNRPKRKYSPTPEPSFEVRTLELREEDLR